ncbi:MAG: hypothetical protein GXZ09_04530 [Syntrophomonadaceae bacterium]|jgi:hypothetical protein|nr:hypothetical protein [Syntrophomonadaceae bacterium]
MADKAKKQWRCIPWCMYLRKYLPGLKGQSGLTLLETVLALFLLLLMLHSVMAVYWHVFLATSQLQDLPELQYSVRRSRQYLAADLAACIQVQVKDASGQPAVSGPHLFLTMSDELLHYYIDNDQLYRDSNHSSPLPLAEHVNSLHFSSHNPGTVLMLIRAEQNGACCESICSLSYNRYADEVIQGGEE